MNMEETEVTYEPYRFLTKLSPDGKPDYSISDWNRRIENSPEWTEFDQFLLEMKKYLMDNFPKKAEEEKPNEQLRFDNIGGFTFFTKGHHVKRTNDGGNI